MSDLAQPQGRTTYLTGPRVVRASPNQLLCDLPTSLGLGLSRRIRDWHHQSGGFDFLGSIGCIGELSEL